MDKVTFSNPTFSDLDENWHSDLVQKVHTFLLSRKVTHKKVTGLPTFHFPPK
jgi:hypothetical protein